MSRHDLASDSAPSITATRVPLWLASALTVVFSLPFGLWLGKFNFTLWCSFIVWAQYFALGATRKAVPVILLNFAYTAILTGATLTLVPYLDFIPDLLTPGDIATAIAFFLAVAFMVYSMNWSPLFQEGSLPFFNGISMALAVYYSGQFPHLGPDALQPIVAAGWASAMGVFGIVLGMLTVVAQLPVRRSA
jgi:hypothetical protein